MERREENQERLLGAAGAGGGLWLQAPSGFGVGQARPSTREPAVTLTSRPEVQEERTQPEHRNPRQRGSQGSRPQDAGA